MMKIFIAILMFFVSIETVEEKSDFTTEVFEIVDADEHGYFGKSLISDDGIFFTESFIVNKNKIEIGQKVIAVFGYDEEGNEFLECVFLSSPDYSYILQGK